MTFWHVATVRTQVQASSGEKDIWTLARHKTGRQFQHWQKVDAKATKADDDTFERILAMSPRDFAETVAKRRPPAQ